jgi:PAS domain S-box-containing protein
LYIVASVSQKEETKGLISQIIKQSILYGVIIFILLSLFVFFITNKRLHSYLKQIEDSNKQLRTVHKALEQSENKFQTLFNNSSDEVFVADFKGKFLELNQSACESLEYSREELLQMNFFDIKTKKYRQFVSENIKKIQEKGRHTYETEHVSKSGKIIQYEMKSKIVEYEGKKAILSIARNISERKALQKRIIQTIIETEMKERKRFSAELHDGLGPILSTIKLYSDLIKKGNFNNMTLEEAVSNIDELVELAISSAKEISNNITPNVLHDFGLKVAINEFCSYVNRTQSINIDVDTNGYTLEKTSIETTVLYQTTKELINNTIKHAQAQNIRIQLKSNNNQIILYYRDDGVGFNLNEKLGGGGGLGLNNIVNKIKTLKGSCDFNTREGKGMFLLISFKVEMKTAKSSIKKHEQNSTKLILLILLLLQKSFNHGNN